jgi:virginiamycin B lyase
MHRSGLIVASSQIVSRVAGPRRGLAAVAGAACLLAGGVVSAAGPTIVEIPTPSPQCLPQGLDVAGDGSVFYTETGAGKIARVVSLHVTREYTLPGGASPNIVKVDGSAVWFTDGGNAAIGRLDPDTGAVVEYPVPSGSPPNFLQIAPDGSKWFSEPTGVGRLSPSGVVTEWQVTLEKDDSHIEQISVGPGGDVWFTELNYDGAGPDGTNLVRRLHPATNVVTAYPVPTFGGTPAGVVAAPSGDVWVSEYWAGTLALLDPDRAPSTSSVVAPNASSSSPRASGRTHPSFFPAPPASTAVTASFHHVTPVASPGWLEYPIPTPGANAEDMRLDDRGDLFFEEDGGMLGVLVPASGGVTEYPIPSANSGYYNIAIAGGDVWFAEAGAFGPVPTKVGVLRR